MKNRVDKHKYKHRMSAEGFLYFKNNNPEDFKKFTKLSFQYDQPFHYIKEKRQFINQEKERLKWLDDNCTGPFYARITEIKWNADLAQSCGIPLGGRISTPNLDIINIELYFYNSSDAMAYKLMFDQ